MQEAYGGFAALYDPLMQDVDYDGWAKYLASFLPPAAPAPSPSGWPEWDFP